jgi:hypothetical protein
MSFNPYAPPQADVRDVATPDPQAVPPLWNPGAATAWSLLFSPAFGAYLQMLNWRALGEPALAQQSKNWFIGSMVYLSLAMFGAMLLPDSKLIDLATRGVGLAYLLVWYSLSGKLQVHRVKTRYGKDYPRRGWGQPLLWAVGVFLAFMAVAFVLAFFFLA